MVDLLTLSSLALFRRDRASDKQSSADKHIFCFRSWIQRRVLVHPDVHPALCFGKASPQWVCWDLFFWLSTNWSLIILSSSSSSSQFIWATYGGVGNSNRGCSAESFCFQTFRPCILESTRRWITICCPCGKFAPIKGLDVRSNWI